MPAKLPKWKADAIDDLLNADPQIDAHAIAREFDCTYKTVSERRRKLRIQKPLRPD